jgi:hypothetical protein
MLARAVPKILSNINLLISLKKKRQDAGAAKVNGYTAGYKRANNHRQS